MEKIASLLVEKGITPTKQRLELAGLIFNKNQHFTASNLLSKVVLIFRKQLFITPCGYLKREEC